MKKQMKKEKISKTDPQILELETKVAELAAGWQRTQADFVNFRRQAEADRQNLIKSANTDLILDILPVLDNFQLAAKHTPEELKNNVWAQGISQIEKQLESILSNIGLEKISAVGTQFDHNLHEAIESVESGQPEEEIVEEVQAGYTLNGAVIRAAKVKVSKGKNEQKD